MATDIDYWPYSFIDKEGCVSGREVELVHSVAKHLGMKVEIKPMQWAECLKLAGTHTVDLVLTCAEYATDCDTDDLLYSIPDGADTYTVFGKNRSNRSASLATAAVGLGSDAFCYNTHLCRK